MQHVSEIVSTHRNKIASSLFILFAFLSCRKEQVIETEVSIIKNYLNLPATPFNYSNPALPAFFSNEFITIQNNTPTDNPTTDWGATLGRVLFYDVRLSKSNSISCASCHKQEFGFADTAQFSKGFDGKFTGRHSMSLLNAAFYLNGRFFWDERAASLEQQVLMPIQDSLEMGLQLDELRSRLAATEFYPLLFKQAFGSTDITNEGISKALAQFVRSMISYQSKYDEGRSMVADRDSNFPNFTPQENRGKRIFMGNTNVNCFGCHNTDVFITDHPRNNGLTLTNQDVGIYIHSNDPFDIGKFKAPSLKNVAVRHRYMHDGSIVGLINVLRHYDTGIQMNPNLDPHIGALNGKPATMNLSDDDLEALASFLETLTDHKIMQDEKFSSPF
ncbi:MAG TPA: cytochrome c peroxidase [Flavipsychrobacter sp.]|nr:cytochrome c peroxidase [Flavipsychrobacter sp.]